MEISSVDLANYLTGKDADLPQINSLRQFLVDLFDDLDEIQAIQVSGKLIEYCRDTMLPGLGAIRRTATANARAHKSPDQIATETGLSYVTVSRLITESRSVR